MCTLLCVGARVEKLLSGACKAVSFSSSFSLFFLHSLLSFFIKKRGAKRGEEERGAEGIYREAVTGIIKQKTKTRIQLRVGHFLLIMGVCGVCVWALSLCMCVVYIHIIYIRVGVCVCMCFTHIYYMRPHSLMYNIYTHTRTEKKERVPLCAPRTPDNLCLQTWVWQDYPPNLSILLSGGKENNRDSLSERRAKRERTRCRIGSYKALSCGTNIISWLVQEWRNSSAKQTRCWIQPFMWVLSQRRC